MWSLNNWILICRLAEAKLGLLFSTFNREFVNRANRKDLLVYSRSFRCYWPWWGTESLLLFFDPISYITITQVFCFLIVLVTSSIHGFCCFFSGVDQWYKMKKKKENKRFIIAWIMCNLGNMFDIPPKKDEHFIVGMIWIGSRNVEGKSPCI